MRSTMGLDPLDLGCLEVVEAGTSQTAFILVDGTGERTILWDRDPRLLYEPEKIQPGCFQSGQVLHMDPYDLPACLQAAGWAKQAGMKVSLDLDGLRPGVEPLLQLADFLLPTLNFVCAFTNESSPETALLALDRSVPGFLAATDGSRGCLAVWEEQIFHIPAFPVTPVDTTGAGDVFHGAFLFSLFQNWPVEMCLRFSNAAAALSTTRLGSRDGIPELAEVNQLMSTASS